MKIRRPMSKLEMIISLRRTWKSDDLVDKLVDSSLGNEFVDATQCIEDYNDVIENFRTDNLANNQKFLHESQTNLSDLEDEDIDNSGSDHMTQDHNFTLVKTRNKKKKLKTRNPSVTRSKVGHPKPLK